MHISLVKVVKASSLGSGSMSVHRRFCTSMGVLPTRALSHFLGFPSVCALASCLLLARSPPGSSERKRGEGSGVCHVLHQGQMGFHG